MTFNKPPEWGSQFHFPENIENNFDDPQMSFTEKLCVEMVDNYETAVVGILAMVYRLISVTNAQLVGLISSMFGTAKDTVSTVGRLWIGQQTHGRRAQNDRSKDKTAEDAR